MALHDPDIDYRARPECYRIGRGEQGVMTVEPYKSELLPLWRFRDTAVARESIAALLERFETYRETDDFVGMDMARKFLQMGYTRARRYACHRSGRKYAAPGRERPGEGDPRKAQVASLFYAAWTRVREDPAYRRAKRRHQQRRRANTAR